MEAIKLRKKIDSEVLHLPEIKRFLGKNVEIIFLEIPQDETLESKRDMKLFLSAAGKIEIDEASVVKLREESMI